MGSHAAWVLRIDPGVLKTLKQIPRPKAEAIFEILKFLPKDPYFGDIQKIENQDDVWRRRMGSYRLFYRIKQKEKIILVFRLERRTSKTY